MSKKPEAKRLLEAAEKAGLTMDVYYPNEGTDYKGTSAAKAWEAVTACEEMHVKFINAEGTTVGWAFILPDLEPDETVVDYSGHWIDTVLARVSN